jgi:hypothetical protein
MAKADSCLVPGCKRPVGPCRGICLPCYQKAAALVNSGQTTWNELEEAGLIRPHLRKSSPMGEALQAYRSQLKRK